MARMYVLREIGDTSQDALFPNDFVILLMSGTNTSGDHDVDLSLILKPTAQVAYSQFMVTNLVAGVLDSDKPATSPGDSSTVITMIVVPQNELLTL